jgi:hypothetical protein
VFIHIQVAVATHFEELTWFRVIGLVFYLLFLKYVYNI